MDEGTLQQARHLDHLLSTILTFIEGRHNQRYLGNVTRLRTPSAILGKGDGDIHVYAESHPNGDEHSI